MGQRIRNLLRRERVDAEIEAELRSHVEMAVEDGMRAGVPEGEARRAARLRFGNPVTVRERTMGADAALGLEGLWRDMRFAVRQLRKSPGFAVTGMVTLALGIGATTAVFSLIQQVLLRSLPVANPGQLWRVGDAVACCYARGYSQTGDERANDWSLFSWEAYRHFRANTPGFEELAAFEIGEGNAQLAVRRAGSAAPAQTSHGEYVSGNFFRTFGLSAWRGRLFTDADDREGAAPVAVMSFHAWQEQYGSDPTVVGGAVAINGHPFAIIGIAPPGFYGAKIDADAMPDIWLPLATEPLIAGPTSRLKKPSLAWLDLIGRVRPGTNAGMLEAQLQGELHQWLGSHVADMSSAEKAAWQKQTLHVTPGARAFRCCGRNIRKLCGCCWARRCACCWWPAPTSPICCWRGGCGTGSRPRYTWRWDRREGGWCAGRWWKAWCWREWAGGRRGGGVGGSAADPAPCLAPLRAEQLDSGAGFALDGGAAVCFGRSGGYGSGVRHRARRG